MQSDTPSTPSGDALPEKRADAPNDRREPAQGAAGRFLRKRTPAGRLAAASFAASLLGALALLAVYHWPRVNILVYYFTVRPSFVWFGMLFPFLAAGVFGLRLRWFVAGTLVWATAFGATEELVQCAKLFPGAAREEFWISRMAFNSYLDTARPQSGSVNVPLRIVTWNFDGATRHPQKLVNDLAAIDPDIVFIQEIGFGGRQQAAEAIRNSRAFEEYHLETGRAAILSRFPITRVEHLDATLRRTRGGAWKIHIGPGLCVAAVNVHLSTQGLRTQLVRGVSMAMLERLVDRSRAELAVVEEAVERLASETPVVLAGDFNLPANYADLRRATRSLKDAFRENGYGWGKTVRPQLPVSRIDLIFVPPDARVYYAAAIDGRGSDHRMALAEVSIPVSVRDEPQQPDWSARVEFPLGRNEWDTTEATPARRDEIAQMPTRSGTPEALGSRSGQADDAFSAYSPFRPQAWAGYPAAVRKNQHSVSIKLNTGVGE